MDKCRMDHDRYICLITPHEERMLQYGGNISCKNHRHINRYDALKLIGGGKTRPHLEDDKELRLKWMINFNYHPIADWAMLQNGSPSQKHIVLRHAREWRQVKNVMQFVVLGGKGRSNGNRYKIHCKPPRAPKCKIISKGLNDRL